MIALSLILLIHIFALVNLKVPVEKSRLCYSNELSTIGEVEIIACAEYYENEGWHVLEIETFSDHANNDEQSYAAGFLEGSIYYKYINFHYTNINKTIFNDRPLAAETLSFIAKQVEFLQNYSKSKESGDFSNEYFNLNEYKNLLSYTYRQWEGVYDGYLSKMHKEKHENFKILSKEEFYLITMQGDLEDIIPAFEQLRTDFPRERECSGFVKYVKEDHNLIVGHDTHNIYTLMNRIYKSYKFNITDSNGKLYNNFKYASRPGDLNSKDDYYVLTNNMVVLESSLEIPNHDLYKNLKSQTIPKWLRTNIANKLATTNQEWIDIFFHLNSGTHNNQWLIINMNEFEKYINIQNSHLFYDAEPEGILHIVEQIPVLDRKYYEDVSKTLFKDTYFATYNAPYFEEVKEVGGFISHNVSDYYHAHRHYLFKELHKNVKNAEDVKYVMRYHDSEEICDTICPRCDYTQNRPFGGVDGKVTDLKMMKNDLKSHLIYGPSHTPGVSEPFNFTLYSSWSHLGIPEYFDFNWIIA
jgi:hypothetical protein